MSQTAFPVNISGRAAGIIFFFPHSQGLLLDLCFHGILARPSPHFFPVEDVRDVSTYFGSSISQTH